MIIARTVAAGRRGSAPSIHLRGVVGSSHPATERPPEMTSATYVAGDHAVDDRRSGAPGRSIPGPRSRLVASGAADHEHGPSRSGPHSPQWRSSPRGCPMHAAQLVQPEGQPGGEVDRAQASRRRGSLGVQGTACESDVTLIRCQDSLTISPEYFVPRSQIPLSGGDPHQGQLAPRKADLTPLQGASSLDHCWRTRVRIASYRSFGDAARSRGAMSATSSKSGMVVIAHHDAVERERSRDAAAVRRAASART